MEQKNKSRARVRLAVFVVISVHVIGLVALLMQGCRKPGDTEPEAEPIAAMDTNDFMPVFEPTNAPEIPPLSDTNTTAVYNPLMPEQTPLQVPAVPEQAPSSAQEYKIVRGDTFSSIATKFGVTARQIQEANPNVQATRLQIGQTIRIPAPTVSPAASGSSTPPAATAGGQQTYKVKSGDTLSRIASTYHVTVRELRSENNLVTDRITVGQVLKIPSKAAPGTAPTTVPSGQ